MRLIDADRLKKAFCSHCDGEEPCTEPCIDIGLIETAPTIEAVKVKNGQQIMFYHEVKHGEWISNGHWYYCSNCGHEMFFTGIFDEEQRYCYYCGAKMDGKEQADEHM